MTLRVRASVPERGVEVALEVGDRETLALIGPNGAGKSTVLGLVAGLVDPRDGVVELDGQVLTQFRGGHRQVQVAPHARRITTLRQDPALFPHLSVRGNVVFALRARGATLRTARREAAVWLERTGLTGLGDRRPAQLSGGQAQRVAIARALAARPRLLLLDEPMAALDVDVAPALREMLRQFLADHPAIVVSHDVLDAMTLADRLCVMTDGAVLEQGTTLEVLSRPRSAFAARFAGLNLLSGTWDGTAVVLPSGERLLGAAGPELVAGTPVHACFRPSDTNSSLTGSATGTCSVLAREVTSLEPLGDRVRVRTADVSTEATAQQIASGAVTTGALIHIEVPARAVTVYAAAGETAPNRSVQE